MNNTVLITGATSGIGYEFAQLFSAKGYDLIIIGRNKEKLWEMKKKISKQYDVNVFEFYCDFSDTRDIHKLYSSIKEKSIDIDILINNAGIGCNGAFYEIPWHKHEEVINVNITSLTCLTRYIIEDMKTRGQGKILNISSTGAYQPGPLINVYYATKAYVLSFSQALKEEVKDLGISVTVLCPGATKTNFSKRAGKGDLKVAMNPKVVAYEGYQALMKNKNVYIPGKMNKVLTLISKFLPGSVNAKLVKKIQQKAISNN